MAGLTTWDLLGIAALLFLVFLGGGKRNAVWGSLIIGVVVALVAGMISSFYGAGYSWLIAEKILTVATLVGASFEIVSRMMAKRTKEKKTQKST